MADTIINTPRADDSSNAAGWVLAIVLVAAVLFAGFWWVQNAGSPNVPNTGTNINVTVPGTGDSGGGTGTGTTY